MSCFDCRKQIVGSVIYSRNDIGIAFCICSPKNNDFVKVILVFEGTLPMLAKTRPEFLLGGVTYRMSLRICSTWASHALLPSNTLSALSSWFAAMKSG